MAQFSTVFGLDSWGVLCCGDTILVCVDEKYFRPIDIDNLVGDSSKARNKLGWEPEVKFKELVHLMVDHDLNIEKNQRR